MGYISQVACHVRGKKSKFFDIQEEYFKELNQVNFNSPARYMLDTSCIEKQEYIRYGQSLWHTFSFNPVEDKKVDGKFITHDVKWGNVCHQWEKLSEIFTKYKFSWYYLYSGQEEGDIIIRSNKKHLRNFDLVTMSYFSMVESCIQPIGIKPT